MAAISSDKPSANLLWQRWFTFPDDVSPAERRFNSWFALVMPIGVLVHALFILLFAYWEVWPMAIANVFSVILWILALVAWRKGRLTISLALIVFEMIAHATLALIMVGWGFGAQYYLYPLATGLLLMSWWPRWLNMGSLLLSAVSFVLYYFYAESYPPLFMVPPVQLSVAYIINTISSFLTMAMGALYLVVENERAELTNEALLNNVLPKPIAARLKKKEPTIADGFQNASILFADLAGFTRLSLKLKPDDLVEMLDTIFSRFDELVDQYGLEKIKTIGDEYMVASGIPIPRDDHAQALANFAMAMRDSLAEYSEANGIDLQMRIGLNSGPVVAGVIGKRRFLYDLWGDSVNTASRMESHGIPGEIQLTEATRDLLDDHFTFINRGVIDIKGKGPMQTYFLQLSENSNPQRKRRIPMDSTSTTNPEGQGEIVPLWFLRKVMTPLYVYFNSLTGGRYLNTLQGKDVCFVTMKGAKSGKMRTIPLMYVPYVEGILLVASQGGAHTHPEWYYNLIKNGDIDVTHRGRQMKLRARLATADEKPDLWPICDQHYPPYAVYRERTTREIPIFVCEQRTG